MKTTIPPTTTNNTSNATSTRTPSSRISQGQGEDQRTQDLTLPNNNNNDTSIFNHNITNVDTSEPVQPTNDKERLETFLHLVDTILQTHKKPDDHSGAADLLLQLGKTYRCLGDKLINHLSSLLCFEKSLKICLALVGTPSANHTRLSEIYMQLGQVYQDLKDINKAFACFKAAYWLTLLQTFEPGLHQKSLSRLSKIQSLLQIELNDLFTVGMYERPCIILFFGEIDLNYINLALLKQKIKTDLLDRIANAVEKGYGWSYITLGSDWGIKGYIDRDYVKKILKGLGELGKKEENIELAQMLCFEAMNLAILKRKTKHDDNNIITEFAKAYPDLTKKIDNEHPEFFVDASKINVYQDALPEIVLRKTLLKDEDYFLKL